MPSAKHAMATTSEEVGTVAGQHDARSRFRTPPNPSTTGLTPGGGEPTVPPMRRYSLFHALPLSFFSGELYRDVARSWRGIGMVYLVLLVALATLVVVIRMQVGLGRWAHGEARGLTEQIPRMVIRHRVVEVDAAMPHVIHDLKTGTAVAIIDTTGQVTSLEGQAAFMLVTSTQILYRKSTAETRVFELAAVKDFTIDSARAGRWLGLLATWAAPIAAVFVFAGLFCFRLLQQLMLAAIGLLAARAVRAPLDFSALMRLAAVALTPALLLEPLLDILGVRPPGFGMIWILIVLFYVVWAVRANRPDPTAPATAVPATPA